MTSARRRTGSAAALAVALLSSCTERNTTAAPAPAQASAPAALGGERGRQVAALAFASPGGTGAADRRVARAQEQVRKGATPGAWNALGSAWVQKARESSDPGFHVHADACAEAALALAPGDRGALHLRTLVHLNAHRFAEALRVADELVARDGDDALAHGLRSDALLELGREEEAMQAGQRMMALKPGAPAYTRASYLLWLRGDAAGAKNAARLAIQAALDPSDPEPRAWAIVQAAHLFWHAGDLPGSEAGYDLALAELPSYPPALVGKARVRLARGDARAAADLAEKAWHRAPLVETGWLLGDARTAAGDESGARDAYDRVVRDGRTGDRRTLGLFLATKGRDVDEALKLLGAEREVRKDLYTEDAWAWALYRAGRLDEAQRAAERATRLGTPDARLLYHAGAIQIALGRRSEGLRLLRRADELNPAFDPTGAREAREILAASGQPAAPRRPIRARASAAGGPRPGGEPR